MRLGFMLNRYSTWSRNALVSDSSSLLAALTAAWACDIISASRATTNSGSTPTLTCIDLWSWFKTFTCRALWSGLWAKFLWSWWYKPLWSRKWRSWELARDNATDSGPRCEEAPASGRHDDLALLLLDELSALCLVLDFLTWRALDGTDGTICSGEVDICKDDSSDCSPTPMVNSLTSCIVMGTLAKIAHQLLKSGFSQNTDLWWSIWLNLWDRYQHSFAMDNNEHTTLPLLARTHVCNPRATVIWCTFFSRLIQVEECRNCFNNVPVNVPLPSDPYRSLTVPVSRHWTPTMFSRGCSADRRRSPAQTSALSSKCAIRRFEVHNSVPVPQACPTARNALKLRHNGWQVQGILVGYSTAIGIHDDDTVWDRLSDLSQEIYYRVGEIVAWWSFRVIRKPQCIKYLMPV